MQTYETITSKIITFIDMSWYQIEVEADKYKELQELLLELSE